MLFIITGLFAITFVILSCIISKNDYVSDGFYISSLISYFIFGLTAISFFIFTEGVTRKARMSGKIVEGMYQIVTFSEDEPLDDIPYVSVLNDLPNIYGTRESGLYYTSRNEYSYPNVYYNLFIFPFSKNIRYRYYGKIEVIEKPKQKKVKKVKEVPNYSSHLYI